MTKNLRQKSLSRLIENFSKNDAALANSGTSNPLHFVQEPIIKILGHQVAHSVDDDLFNITVHQKANHTLIAVNMAELKVQFEIWNFYETTEWTVFILLSLTMCFTSVWVKKKKKKLPSCLRNTLV